MKIFLQAGKNSVGLMCQNNISRLSTDCRKFELIYCENPPHQNPPKQQENLAVGNIVVEVGVSEMTAVLVLVSFVHGR